VHLLGHRLLSTHRNGTFMHVRSSTVGQRRGASVTSHSLLYIACLQLSPRLQLSWEKLRAKPATRQFDESFAPMHRLDKRFARQHSDQPPPSFPTASLSQGIVHCLSGSDTTCPLSNPVVLRQKVRVHVRGAKHRSTSFSCARLCHLVKRRDMLRFHSAFVCLKKQPALFLLDQHGMTPHSHA